MTALVHCDWMVLCRRVVEDAQTQQLTLQQCLERIEVYDTPAIYPGVGFAAALSRGQISQRDEQWEFALMRASRQEPAREVLRTRLRWCAQDTRVRVFTNFAVLKISETGPLTFQLRWRRMGGKRWQQGPAVSLDICLKSLPAEQQEQLRSLNIHYVPEG